MIPGIQEYTRINGQLQEGFPSYATLSQAVLSFEDMGERTISTQIKIDGDVTPDFSGWELMFKGERFVLTVNDPQAAKDNSSRCSVVDLSFESWAISEMKRYYFFSLSSAEAGVAVPDQYVGGVNLPIRQLVDLFNDVLVYYFGTSVIEMDLFDMEYSTEPIFLEMDYAHIWDVLTQFYEKTGYRWVLVNENGVCKIKVNYPEASVEGHDFEYGYNGGLLRFERQVQDEAISNVLLGRGGEKNVPYRYFKRVDPQNPEWTADPDALYELKDVYFDRLRDANFRWYVRGWMQNANRNRTWEQAEEPYLYPTYTEQECPSEYLYAFRRGKTDDTFRPIEYVRDEDSIQEYGPRWGAVENNDDVFPTIQGVRVDPEGRVDQTISVSDIVTDNVDAAAKAAVTENLLDGVNKISRRFYGTNDPGHSGVTEFQFFGEPFTVPEGKTANLQLTGGDQQFFVTGATAVGSDHEPSNMYIAVALATQLQVENVDTGDVVAATALHHGTYRYIVTLRVTNTRQDGRDVFGTVGFNGVKAVFADEDDNAWKPTFDIWVKNIWGSTRLPGETDSQYSERVWGRILGDRVGDEAKIVFSSGPMSISQDYEFQIAAYPTPDESKTLSVVEGGVTNTYQSEWKITLRKSEAEMDATGLFVPNAETGGKPVAGDTFYFIGIDMPFDFVVLAEQRLSETKASALDKEASINPTWVVSLDKVRVNTMEPEDVEYGQTLADRLSAGCLITAKDSRFAPEAGLELHVQTLTYTWKEGDIVPDIEVVLSDEHLVSSNPVAKLEGDVSSIRSSYVRAADLDAAIRRVATPLFLRKTGESDNSDSPTTFASRLSSRSFRQGDIGGAGWGYYEEGDGSTVLELDKVVVRKEMRVNSLVSNQVVAVGGMQVRSAASMLCSFVLETEDGYECHFDQKQGTVANLFQVGDFGMGVEFDAENNDTRYYRARVIEVGVDYIVLSKTVKDGAAIPRKGDTIVQYGNDTNAARQYAIVSNVIDGGYERMIGGLSTVSSSGTEYYFAGKQSQSASPRWFVGDINGEYAQWSNGQLNIKGRLSVLGENGQYADIGYLADALPLAGSTLISGGLILSSTIKLGQEEAGAFRVFSGLNGILDQQLQDPTRTIAAWYGGEMLEKEVWDNMSAAEKAEHMRGNVGTYAKSLFRHDGSGYLASNKIYWGPTGDGGIPGITWSGDNITISGNVKLGSVSGDTVTDMLTLLRQINNWFGEDANGDIYVKKNSSNEPRNFYSYGAVTAGGLNPGGGGGGGTIDLARMWQSLMNVSAPVADNPNNKIALAHIPNVPVSHINGLGSLATMNDITTAYITDFPSAMPASDVYAWAKKVNLDINDVPTIPYSKTSGFGAAALKGVASSVVSGDSSNLVTGAAVYSAINSALSSAIKYQGITTTVLTDGATTNPIVINGESFTAHFGDEVIYGGKEFLYTGTVWQQLGDEESWALKTIQIIAGTGLTGGGTLEASRTLSLSAATIASLGKADTALQSADIYGLTINNYAGTALATYNPIGGAASVTLTKAVVGLGNVDNTADADKNVAYATNAGSAGNAGTLENHAASYFATASALSSVSNTVSALAARQNWDDIFGIDANGDVYVKKNGNVARGFYSYGFVTAGGLNPGGGGAGTIDLPRMWQALMNTNAPVADDPNNKIAVAHIPTLSIAQTTGLQSALDAKQNTISDLSTIRSRADEGHTAYGYFSSGILGTSHVPDLAISKITGLQTALDGKQSAYGFTINGTSGATYNLANFVTSSGVTSITAGTGLSGGTITSSGTIGIASGYKLPTTTEWAAKADASALAGYLPLSGGTMTGMIVFENYTSFGVTDGKFYLGHPSYPLVIRSSGTPTINGYTVITGANIGSQSVSYATTAGSAPASDVYSWAKQPTKPSYHAGELDITPRNYKVSYVAAGIAPYISEIGTNIFSGATTSEITVERSTDDGSTWVDVTAAEAANVKNVFSGCVEGALFVSARSHGEVGDKLRITFNPAGSTRYCQLAFIYIYYTTMGAGTTCLVEKNTYTDQNVWTTYVADAPISGWSGPNVIGMGGTYFGQGDSRNSGYGLRFTFRINSVVSADYDSRGIIKIIQGFTSNRAWGRPSGNSIARANVPYSFTNADRAVSFDNTVAASGFIRANSNDSYVLLGGGGHAALNTLSVNYASSAGSASSATALATARTLWGQSFDGSANVSGAMTGVDSINGFVTFGANRLLEIGSQNSGATARVYGLLSANSLSSVGNMDVGGNIVASGTNAQHSFSGTTTIKDLSVTSAAYFGKNNSPVDVYVRGPLTVGSSSANRPTKLNGTLNATGNTTIGGTLSVTGTVKTGSKYYFGDTGAYFEYVNIGTAADPVYAIHSNVGIYSDSFVSAGGLNSQSGGGAGAGLADVWNSLTGTVVDQWANTQINLSHIPVIPMAKLASDVQNAISDAGRKVWPQPSGVVYAGEQSSLNITFSQMASNEYMVIRHCVINSDFDLTIDCDGFSSNKNYVIFLEYDFAGSYTVTFDDTYTVAWKNDDKPDFSQIESNYSGRPIVVVIRLEGASYHSCSWGGEVLGSYEVYVQQ